MNEIIRDDNLRLVFSKTERIYIEAKFKYHRQSLIYCALFVVGWLFYLELLPLLQVIWQNSEILLKVIALLWGIFVFCSLLMAIPISIQVRKYQKFMLDHQKFMRKYNRK